VGLSRRLHIISDPPGSVGLGAQGTPAVWPTKTASKMHGDTGRFVAGIGRDFAYPALTQAGVA